MTTRKFTVTFDVSDQEFDNFMVRLGGGAVLNKEPARNTTVTVDGEGDDDAGPVNANAPAIDGAGVPYDARYHAKTKNFKDDGTWKRAKGLSDALKAEADAFEAQHKAAFAAASAAPVVPPVVETPVVAAVVETPVVAAVVETPAPVAAVVETPVGLPVTPVVGMPGLPMPVAAVAVAPVSYEEVVARFGEVAKTHPFVASNYVQLYADCGITDAQKLTTDETLRRKLFDKLNEIAGTPAVAA